MSDDVEARIEVVVRDEGGDSPPVTPSPSPIVIPEYYRRPASQSPSVGIVPVAGSGSTLPQRDISGRFVSRNEVAGIDAAALERAGRANSPRNARGQFIRQPAAASPAPPNPPTASPAPSSTSSGSVFPSSPKNQLPIPRDQLEKLTPQQRLELQETWGLDLGEFNVTRPTRSRAEQKRIARMQVNSLKQERQLAEADQGEKQRKQAEADKDADAQRKKNERNQQQENKEAIQRTRQRERIRNKGSRSRGRGGFGGSGLYGLGLPGFAQRGMASGRMASRAVQTASRFMSPKIAGRAGAAAGPVGAAVAAGVAGYFAANAAANKLAADGIVPLTKSMMEWMPILGAVIDKFDAIEQRFNRDKSTYGRFSSGITHATAYGEANLTLNRVNRLYNRNSVAGGRSLNDLMGEKQQTNYRFQNAQEQLEAELSKALYNWSNPWLKQMLQFLEVAADNSETIGLFVTGLLNIGTHQGLSALFALNPVLISFINTATSFIKWWRGDKDKENAEKIAERMKLFQEKFQSDLMAIFNDGMNGLPANEKKIMEDWLKSGGGQKRPGPK